MEQILHKVQQYFSKNYTASMLRLMIIVWAIFVVILALSIENPWLLAGILAYEVLP